MLHLETALVVMGALYAVLQHLSGFGIHPDLVGHLPVLDVEGIAQAAATPFLLQFLRDDLAGVGLESNGARFIERDLGLPGIFLTRERYRLGIVGVRRRAG